MKCVEDHASTYRMHYGYVKDLLAQLNAIAALMG